MKLTSQAVAVLTLLTAPQTSAAENSPGGGVEVATGFNIQVKVDPSDPYKAIFEIYMRDNTWMGLVLGGSGMAPGNDMI